MMDYSRRRIDPAPETRILPVKTWFEHKNWRHVVFGRAPRPVDIVPDLVLHPRKKICFSLRTTAALLYLVYILLDWGPVNNAGRYFEAMPPDRETLLRQTLFSWPPFYFISLFMSPVGFPSPFF